MSLSNKYEISGYSKFHQGRILHRIVAIKAFGGVKAGDLGGWIECERNLSQVGNCWVYGDAAVYNFARITHDATVGGNAEVYNDATASDFAVVGGNARVYVAASITGRASIYGHAHVLDEARVTDYAQVYGNSCVRGNALICVNAQVMDTALISGTAILHGCDKAKGNVMITGDKEKDAIALIRSEAATWPSLPCSKLHLAAILHTKIPWPK